MTGIEVPELCDHIAACIKEGKASDAMADNVQYVKRSYEAQAAEIARLRHEIAELEIENAENIGLLTPEEAKERRAILSMEAPR